MKTLFKRRAFSLSILLMLCFSISIQAQNILEEDGPTEDLYESKAHILEHLDLAGLSPGNLWDFGLSWLDLSPYDGSSHSGVYVDEIPFGKAYASILSMPMASSEQLPLATNGYSNEMTALTSSDVVPIMALDYTINRLKPNCLDDNILYEVNGQLKETPGNSIYPFETLNSFLSTPMKTTFYTSRVQVEARPDLYFTNTSKTLTDVGVDFGNGSGMVSIGLNSMHTEAYVTPGEYTWTIRYQFNDGTSFENLVKVDVIFPDASRAYDGFNQNETPVYTTQSAPKNVDVYINYNCAEVGLRKPLIFVEGFNPPQFGEDQNLRPNGWLINLDRNVLFEEGSEVDLLSYCEAEGYDLIYIDYHDGAAAIQHNAAAVIEAIGWINQQKALNGSVEKNVLIGSSMGGLVGKYALRTMELNGGDHETELFASFDTPMRGANVPLGAQFAARDIPNIDLAVPTVVNPEGDAVWWNPTTWNYIQPTQEIKEIIPAAGLGERVLNTPAARQMLILQCGTNVEGGIPSAYSSFMAEFHGLGDLEHAREIAISNGSQLGNNQVVGEHEQLVNLSGLGFAPAANLYFDIEIWSLPNFPEDKERIYRGNMLSTVLGVIPTSVHLKKYKVDGVPAYDSAPGGHYDIGFITEGANLAFAAVPQVLTAIFNLDLGVADIPNFCFIPAVSAIDVSTSFFEQGHLPINMDISDNLTGVTNGTTHYKNYVGETGPDADGFNNHRHEVMTERNASLLRFEMMGDNQGLASLITSDFNFGESEPDGLDFIDIPFYRTTDRLQNDHEIFGNGTLVSVNESGTIGGSNNTALNTEDSHFDLFILNNSCAATETNVRVISGAELSVGDLGDNNSASVHVYGNANLSSGVDGTIRVKGNGTLEIHDGGKLSMDGGRIILESGARLIIHKNGEFILNGGTLEVNGSARVESHHFSDIYYQGGQVLLNNTGSVFELGGTMYIANDATFQPTSETSQIGHVLVPANGNGFWGGHLIAQGSNCRVKLQGNSPSDLVLKVEGNAEFSVDWQNTVTSLNYMYIYDGRVELADNAKLSVNNCRYFKTNNASYNGGNVWLYGSNVFQNCKLNNVDLKGDFVYNPTKNLRAWNTEFVHTNVKVSVSGYSFYGCSFLKSHIDAHTINRTSTISGCTFLGDSDITNLNFNSALNIRTSEFTADADGFIDHSGGTLSLKCNEFNAYHIYLTETFCNMSVPERAGYNVFTGRNEQGDIIGDYISLDKNSELDLFDGYNTFEATSGQTQINPGGYFSATLNLDGRNNYWKVSKYVHGMYVTIDEGPVPERFGYSAGPGQTYTIVVQDDIDNRGFEGCDVIGGGRTRKSLISDGSIDGEVKEGELYRVYPNPFSKDISIVQVSEGEFNESLEFIVHDISGKEVYKRKLDSTTPHSYYDIGHLAQGSYIYKIYADGIPIQTGKIIKQ